jgi:hypothetical protein
MRKSRVLLAGVAVAAAGVATSAFTASNDFSGVTSNVAGYSETSVSGAVLTAVKYTPDTDVSKLASVVFTTSNDVTGDAATLVFTLAGTASTGGANSCTATDASTITCTLTAPMPFVNFDKIGLTVVSQ